VSYWQSENERNVRNKDLYEAIVREAIPDVTVFAAGHHLMFQTADGGCNEFSSADTLIFNHDVAKKIWPDGDDYLIALKRLAFAPVETRDSLLHKLFYGGASA
jgi:hypothetical protein